ncbi:MAG: phosphoglycerate kinase [Patescibacteria group bacterium]|nr:phosphoglycerate kinase [Patescibacteria group bacterium]
MAIRQIDKLDFKDKRILLRLELNVPLKDGKVQDTTRIEQALPTVKFLLKGGASVIIVAHAGRPNGNVVEELRLTEIAKEMEKLLGHKIKKLDEAIGKKVEKEIEKMKPGEIIMLENIRFYPEEEANDIKFSKTLASYADYFVMDAFGTTHRAHASTHGVAEYIPAYAGILVSKEIHALSPLLEQPRRPITLVLGGAKIWSKIGIIKNFIAKADHILLGGGIANTFLYAQGHYVGESLFEKDKVDIAREIMLDCEKNHDQLHLPEDVIVADEMSDDAKTLNVPVTDIEGDAKIFDIGPRTAEKYAQIIKNSQTIFWNGPMGLYEHPPFKKGSETIAKAMAETYGTAIVGGGDSVDCIKRCGYKREDFTHISTGGGASLEFLAGTMLPGIEPLLK